jgi:hypothetical protein
MEHKELSHRGPRATKQVKMTADQVEASVRELGLIGINLPSNQIAAMIAGIGMDNSVALNTTASITTPVQFLQNWLPGFVEIITAARKIDDIVGITTSGSWEDEEVVQGVLERTGTAIPYGDLTTIPLSGWNTNFERRTIVRFEQGMQVGSLEEARAAKIRVNSAAEKRIAAGVSLEIQRNRVGFVGFNSGANRTYGFLNDPALPAYVAVPNGAAGTPTWATKTFNEIVADILSTLRTLRTNSKDKVDPSTAPITMACATAIVDYLATVNSLGTMSVWDWLKKTYPNVRVVSAPELDAANGGANVFYMFAENVADSGSDGGRTFVQIVPSKFNVLGVEKGAKGYKEDYSNATAGIFCKRPYAVVRRTGA